MAVDERSGKTCTVALLFDLGNTLVRYWERHEYPDLLREGIEAVRSHLDKEHLLHVPYDRMWQNVKEEDHENADYGVRSLEGRLTRIFELDTEDCRGSLLEAMSGRFLAPMFARGQVYEDALPTLRVARSKGLRTAIVSNTPWGSPAKLWRAEVSRLGLGREVDAVVFCGDVGWRKPARQIFDHTVERLGAEPQRCVFVGDDPRWDLAGPRALGMQAVLIDRWATSRGSSEMAMSELSELWERVDWRLLDAGDRR